MSADLRISQIRKSEILKNPGVLRLPFLFIQEQFGYSVESILRPLNLNSGINLGKYPDTFPNTIEEYFWIQDGTPGSTPWVALGKLTNGLYFFYTAQCSNTPNTFLDNGHMNLWVSIKYRHIIDYAMDDILYNRYIEETTE
jgi:hypothetical protein